jgi:Tfp pilus assembly protein FimT
MELLVVMGVMGILATLSVAAFNGSRGMDLTNGGNLVVDLANQARENSIANNVMTALVLARDPVNNSKYRLFRLMQLVPGATKWTPASGWISLPQGVVVDETTANSSFLSTQPTLSTSIGTITYSGTSTSYAYQVFLPKGRMSTSGMVSTSSPTLRLLRSTDGSNPNNYYDITFNLYTGSSKVDRP